MARVGQFFSMNLTFLASGPRVTNKDTMWPADEKKLPTPALFSMVIKNVDQFFMERK
jgi:hypothetical protein